MTFFYYSITNFKWCFLIRIENCFAQTNTHSLRILSPVMEFTNSFVFFGRCCYCEIAWNECYTLFGVYYVQHDMNVVFDSINKWILSERTKVSNSNDDGNSPSSKNVYIYQWAKGLLTKRCYRFSCFFLRFIVCVPGIISHIFFLRFLLHRSFDSYVQSSTLAQISTRTPPTHITYTSICRRNFHRNCYRNYTICQRILRRDSDSTIR